MLCLICFSVLGFCWIWIWWISFFDVGILCSRWGGCSVHTAFSALDSICQKLGFSMVLPFLAKEFCK